MVSVTEAWRNVRGYYKDIIEHIEREEGWIEDFSKKGNMQTHYYFEGAKFDEEENREKFMEYFRKRGFMVKDYKLIPQREGVSLRAECVISWDRNRTDDVSVEEKFTKNEIFELINKALIKYFEDRSKGKIEN